MEEENKFIVGEDIRLSGFSFVLNTVARDDHCAQWHRPAALGLSAFCYSPPCLLLSKWEVWSHQSAAVAVLLVTSCCF